MKNKVRRLKGRAAEFYPEIPPKHNRELRGDMQDGKKRIVGGRVILTTRASK